MQVVVAFVVFKDALKVETFRYCKISIRKEAECFIR